jgi:uncharacterized iron-regulated membrane protein
MRRLHRWVSIVSAVFISYVAVTGFVMVFDNIWGSIYMATHGMSLGEGGPSVTLMKIFADDGTVSDGRLSAMLQTTLQAARDSEHEAPMPRVIRLRTYGGMAQGVVVTGGQEAEQLVFNANTGHGVSSYEPGYPLTPMPFQWNAHETWKKLHRGDYFGMSGRVMDLLSGLALLFLTISGITMYLQLYRARRKANRSGLFWK